MGRACSMNVENRNAYKLLVGKPERKRPVGRPRRRWVDTIKMDRTKIRWKLSSGLTSSGLSSSVQPHRVS
jgi:hypothetical protein